MGKAHYEVPVADRGDVARALIAAADDHVHEVRTSDAGFYVDEALWAKAFPPVEEDDDAEEKPPAKPAKPANGQRRRS